MTRPTANQGPFHSASARLSARQASDASSLPASTPSIRSQQARTSAGPPVGRMIGSPPLEAGPLEGVTVDLDTQVRDYHEAMGWDTETGVPKKETLLQLGLDFAAAELHP